MPRPTIKALQHDLNNAKSCWQSYQQRNVQAERELADAKAANAELIRERNWLRQLCQEQSSSIAGYMRSR
jgi:chromosome segregation ATPase